MRRAGSCAGDQSARIEIDYRPEAAVGIRVPVEMREAYGSYAGGVVCPNALEATARYASFRRFTVDTQETIHYRELR